MYNASNDFKTQMKKKARFEHVKGSIGSAAFTDLNVVAMEYTNRCSDTSDVKFGSAYIGQLSATFVGVNIARGAWRNKVITLEQGLVLEDNTTEYIPVGVFTVAAAEWTDQGIKVTAYDYMAKFDKACGITTTSGKIYDLLALACQTCGVTLGVSSNECAALPNGDQTLGLFPNSDIKTWRDFISWVACCCGGFVTMSRDGRLLIKSWADCSVVDSLAVTERVAGSTFSDYVTQYAGISVTNIEAKTTQYYGNQTGAVINLGANPFLQYGTDVVMAAQRTAIATVAQSIAYTPFTTSILSNMIYDLGDLVTCSDGVAGSETLTCCIMSIDWSLKQLTELQGFGKDPALASGKSRTDKNLAGLSSQANDNEMIIYTFTNAAAISVDEDEETSVCKIAFSTLSPKIVNLWHEIELDVTATSNDGIVTCTAHYYLNGEELAYNPVTTWDNDGKHLLHLLYFLSTLEGLSSYQWEVKLELDGGTATIAMNDVHASLYGQGLVAVDAWDGTIEVDDEYSFTLGGIYGLGSMKETVTLSLITPNAITISEDYDFTLGGVYGLGTMTETVEVVRHQLKYNLVTEDGLFNFVTEDGNYNIVTEGD